MLDISHMESSIVMEKDARIYIPGHSGMVGSALLRRLEGSGFTNLLLRTSSELNLTDQNATHALFMEEKPDYVFLAAAKVGGIQANKNYPAEFIYNNLQIQNNVIHSAWLAGVKKLLFLGCSCIYPKYCPQPMKEEYLLTNSLEPTSEPFSIAKVTGIKMCQSYNRQYGTNFISVISTNLYGPNDNFNPETSHLMAALIRKCHIAKIEGKLTVALWGTGTPRREFMHVNDLADACIFLMQSYKADEPVNIGVGTDITIRELTEIVSEVVGFKGELYFDTNKPDGVPRKLLDVSLLHSLGWDAKISLRKGVKDTYRWYLNFQKS